MKVFVFPIQFIDQNYNFYVPVSLAPKSIDEIDVTVIHKIRYHFIRICDVTNSNVSLVSIHFSYTVYMKILVYAYLAA